MLATITDNLSDLSKFLLSAYHNGRWAAVTIGLLIGAVTLLRKYGSNRFPVLKTDHGAVALTFVVGVLGALANVAAGGGALGWALVGTAVKVNFAAMGGFAVLKKFAQPLLDKFGLAWLVTWLTGSAGDAAGNVTKAEAAGLAAVAQAPATGAAGVVKVTEIK